MISDIRRIESPTEVDHYQLRRTIDIYVRPLGEDLGRSRTRIDDIIARTKVPKGLDRHAARHGAGHASSRSAVSHWVSVSRWCCSI